MNSSGNRCPHRCFLQIPTSALLAGFIAAGYSPYSISDILSVADFRAAYASDSVSELILDSVHGDRFAHLELSRRFLNGEGGLNQSNSAALRHYAYAARLLPESGGLSVDQLLVPAVRASRTHVEQVSATQPVASISAIQDQISAPSTLSFSADQSSVSGPDIYYSWQLSDTAGEFPAEGADGQHTYNAPGTFDLLLAVMDSAGRIALSSQSVLVDPPLPINPEPTVLLSPDSSSQLGVFDPLVLRWESAEAVTSYNVVLSSPESETLLSVSIPVDELSCIEGVCTSSYNQFLPVGRGYLLSVQAQNPQGVSDWVERSFDVIVQAGADLCAQMPTDMTPRIIENLSKPALLSSFTDPAFGASMTRITDSPFGIINKPVYSTMQAWNADESLLLLYRTGGSDLGHYLHDGQTYAEIGRLDIAPADIEEIFWSHSDPDTLYYMPREFSRRGEFVKYSVSSGEETLLRKFVEQCPDNQLPYAGGDVQMHSYDDDMFAFSCGAGTAKTMFRYRISTDEVVDQPLGDNSPWIPWNAPNVLPTGKEFFIGGSVLSDDLLSETHLLDMANSGEHASLGLTAEGENALFQVAFNPSPSGCSGAPQRGVAQLVEHNLDTGVCRGVLTEADGYPYPVSGTHISAVAHKRPGWVALSSGSHSNLAALDGMSAAPLFLSEIYLVNTDPNNPQACRLAHHRSYGSSATQGGFNPYFAEPHATISPSGTRLLFGSDWYNSGSVDAYIIELPEFLNQ